MADLPILFSAPMVRALLDGRKTQTRRLQGFDPINDDPSRYEFLGLVIGLGVPHFAFRDLQTGHQVLIKCRMVKGDRLWVREEHYRLGHWEVVAGAKTKGGRTKWRFVPDRSEVLFDPPGQFRKSRSHNLSESATPHWYKRLARFMPRAMSRMTLTVTDVRVERMQSCTEADALAEGVVREREGCFVVPGVDHPNKTFGELSRVNAREMYAALWDVINGSGSWLSSPWIVALTFTVERRNINA